MVCHTSIQCVKRVVPEQYVRLTIVPGVKFQFSLLYLFLFEEFDVQTWTQTKYFLRVQKRAVWP
jgi:hypothetical protein